MDNENESCPVQTGGHILQLIYASAASAPMSLAALTDLLALARPRNAARFITGMLLYHQGSFLQVLEGPPAEVEALYHAIARDSRHGEIRLLLRQEVAARDFPHWSMGFADATAKSRVLAGYQDFEVDFRRAFADSSIAHKVLRRFQDGTLRAARPGMSASAH